ncbi:hypothetical protein ACTFIR_009193 [Dictyostelium discoideum]
MQSNKCFYKATKKGTIIKVVNEIYLRDDIPCGHDSCKECKTKLERRTTVEDRALLSNEINTIDSDKILILDTNVILHQIDLLEDPTIKNCIVLSTVLDEVKSQNRAIFNRIRDVIKDSSRKFYVYSNEYSTFTSITRENGESPNDRNDRAIRVATQWYKSHLHKYSIKVLLITNDKDNLKKAKSLGLDCQTIQDLVFELSDKNPSLVDKLSDPNDDSNEKDNDESKRFQYQEHKPMSMLTEEIKGGKLIQGIFRTSITNYREATVSNREMEKEILIQGIENINRAVDGDIVAVELFDQSKWNTPSTLIMLENEGVEEDDDSIAKDSLISKKQPTGKVVGIIKRNWKPYCGAVEFKQDNNNNNNTTSTGLHFLYFMPIDKRIPKIRIKSRQVSNLIGKRIVVAIDQWDKNSKYPSGHFVKDLGPLGDKETESQVLLLQFDIPHHPFGAAVMKCLPSPDIMDRVTSADMVGRKDLRKECIFSVDPPGCTDIDDALHIKDLGKGIMEVGVHIADVSHFVQEGTAIDEEAANRSTSVYLVDRRIDMLPGELSGNLCSLMSNVDRFAFSCIWKINQHTGEIIAVEYTKSIIRSCASLTYEQAQIRIDDKSQNDQITVNLRNLNSLAKILRKQRFDRGALYLASPQVKFKTEELGGDPSDVEIYQLRDTNSMIEEFMLLANIWVAKKIYKHFPGCAMLRRHPTPNKAAFDLLTKLIENKGYKFSTTTSKDLADSLDSAVDKNDSYFNTLCRIMTTRCMSPAKYFSSGSLPYEDFNHYGLATDIYTHFTSPIRRYPDIIVHRLLASAIGIQSVSLNLENKTISALTENNNFRHKMAQYASRGSTQLHTLIFFKGRKSVEDAYIIRVKANAFVVLVPRYGFEGTVYVSDPNSSTATNNSGGGGASNIYNYNHEDQTLGNGIHTFRVFDKVTVEIYVDDSKAHDQKLKINCINPNISFVPSDDIDSNNLDDILNQENNINKSTSSTSSSNKSSKVRKQPENIKSSTKPTTNKKIKK